MMLRITPEDEPERASHAESGRGSGLVGVDFVDQHTCDGPRPTAELDHAWPKDARITLIPG